MRRRWSSSDTVQENKEPANQSGQIALPTTVNDLHIRTVEMATQTVAFVIKAPPPLPPAHVSQTESAVSLLPLKAPPVLHAAKVAKSAMPSIAPVMPPMKAPPAVMAQQPMMQSDYVQLHEVPVVMSEAIEPESISRS